MCKIKFSFFKIWEILCFMNVLISICHGLNHIRFSTFEEIAIGSIIGSIQEQLSPQLIVYQNHLNYIKMKTELSDFVNISRDSGNVIVNKRIDKESICPKKLECHFKFPVNCFNDHNFLEILEIIIEIKDINDNSCYFVPLDHQTILWQENAIPLETKEFINRPEDLDTHYGIKRSEIGLVNKSELFSLQITQSNIITRPYILELILIGELDYETVQSYHLIIEARDEDLDHKCHLKLNVEVKDINDNNPQFSTNLYQTQISEGYDVFKPFFKVKAQDKDSRGNAKILYEIDSYANSVIKSQFGINSTGEIYLKRVLNYHERKTFKIPIIARNVNMHSRFGTCELIVSVTDINNQVPEISVFSATTGTSKISISEEEVPGKDVGMITVTDKDEGINAKVNCEIIKESLKGSMELRTSTSKSQYRLVTKVKVDREKTSNISITIQCYDFGNPRLTSEKQLLVNILDVNDNAPLFPETNIFISVNEDNDPKRKEQNFLIWKFNAIDKDIGPNSEIKYSLKNIDNFPSDLIFIDSESGDLSSNGKLDRETISSMSFIIIATDQGKERLSNFVLVNCTILDVNDNYPEFSINHGQTYFIPENRNSHEFVDMFFAKDLDFGINSNLIFSIQNSENHFHFQISPKKISNRDKDTFKPELFNYQIEIFSTVSFDRESLLILSDSQPYYEFFIKAQDLGIPRLSRIVKVKVVILDENDNFPHFTFPSENNSRLTLSFKQKVNYRFGKINAIDDDNGVNGSVEYQIQNGNNKNLFSLNALTGDLTLIKTLTDVDVGVYSLNIMASDCGEPRKRTIQTLVVEIDNSSPMDSHTGVISIFNSENAFNLYIIISIIVASLTISVLMLTAICIILKKSHQQRIKKDQSVDSFKDNQPNTLRFSNANFISNSYSANLLPISQNQSCSEPISVSFCCSQPNSEIIKNSPRRFIQIYTSSVKEDKQYSNNSTDMDSGKGDSFDAYSNSRMFCNLDAANYYNFTVPNSCSTFSNFLSPTYRKQSTNFEQSHHHQNNSIDN